MGTRIATDGQSTERQSTISEAGFLLGPPAPVANMGLGNAVVNVMNNAADKGANVTGGTHNAVGRIVVNNPTMDAYQAPFSLLPDNPFCP